MRERPIIMGPESVRAIIAGTKTQTRMVVKPQPCGEFLGTFGPVNVPMFYSWDDTPGMVRAPFWPEMRLWVREGWSPCDYDTAFTPRFRADGGEPFSKCWRSPAVMPRWASRLTLEVVEVRVQRVQEISEEDARAEGLWRPSDDNPYGTHYVGEMIDRFAAAWDRINPKAPWASNPFVWAVTFKRVEAV